MLNSDKVKSSKEGQDRLKQAYKEAGLTQEKLAEEAKVSVDTVKRLLGTKDCPNGVERYQVESIAKVLNIKVTEIVDPKDWYPRQIPLEFERLIEEKTKLFCGREFVFKAIENFLKKKDCGYLKIIGDPGMGKSAIAAKYANDNHAICFFNIRAEGRNRPELFLKSIRQQLKERYDLQAVEDDSLSTLLIKASKELSANDSLVIVVDALDEVDQEDAGNLLNLPTILPERVYFLLTRRPYEPSQQRLSIDSSTPKREFDLREKSEQSNQDIKDYIRQLLKDENYKQGLNQWITKQNISDDKFVEQIARKSENNFMYLRYVLQAIAEGFYENKSLEELPEGLQGYYYSHWQIMGMTTKPLPKDKIKILYVICDFGSPVSSDIIVQYSQQDEMTVQSVLDGWAEFLDKQESSDLPRYRFYHESFRDFLHRQNMVQAARVDLSEIKAEIFEKMEEGIEL